MIQRWRVYNNHSEGLTHREKFKGDMIEIPAGKFVLMDYEDAVQFKGQYFPLILNAQGVQDPSSYKMIKIEPDPDSKIEAIEDKQKIYVCHMDGKEFTNKDELDAYIKENFSHLIVKDENLDDELNKKNKRK